MTCNSRQFTVKTLPNASFRGVGTECLRRQGSCPTAAGVQARVVEKGAVLRQPVAMITFLGASADLAETAERTPISEGGE